MEQRGGVTWFVVGALLSNVVDGIVEIDFRSGLCASLRVSARFARRNDGVGGRAISDSRLHIEGGKGP